MDYMGKKVPCSAMASYNGARIYSTTDRSSICNQSIRPDEIIISDDGSSDNTIEIIPWFSEYCISLSELIFGVLRDNPRKGYCGNFEWAITTTSGHLHFF